MHAQKDKNQMTVEIINTLYVGYNTLEMTANFSAYVKLKEQICFSVQQNSIWISFLQKCQ